ncbi:hypothetical protein D9M73_205190 [compost metagenome]
MSMPSSRAYSMCCFETSASVQWVAMRTERAPASKAALRSCTVPMPGSSSTVIFACWITSAAASIHSRSVWAPKP